MEKDYPDDADGIALSLVAGQGSDMTRPMEIDFQISVDDEAPAAAITAAAQKIGYRTTIYRHEASDPWTCECTKIMMATYDGAIAVQAELDALSEPYGGFSDGWGTLGNVDTE